MAPTTVALPLDDYRRQVVRLLSQAKQCGPDEAGISAALKLRHRADILQTVITMYGS
jgi:hypothetical protein